MTRPDFLSGHVLIAGAGVSGRGCAAVLSNLGVDLTVADGNEDSRSRIAAELDVATVDTSAVDLAEYSLVVTSPGWRPDSPLLVAAASQGLEVIGDVELAYRLDRAEVFGAPRRWLAITGTNGKTTTLSLIHI